jgi:hypothetical protein
LDYPLVVSASSDTLIEDEQNLLILKDTRCSS